MKQEEKQNTKRKTKLTKSFEETEKKSKKLNQNRWTEKIDVIWEQQKIDFILLASKIDP